ncbi:MAG: MerR family transcriptional regulator [Candidatus Limnocylindrales bacterium]
MSRGRFDRDPTRPVYVISVAAGIVRAHPRTLRIYEDEGLLAPARTPTNIRLYSENDIRRILWIRHLTQERGVNLAGIRILFELEERLGTRVLERLFDEGTREKAREALETASTDRLERATGAEAPAATGSIDSAPPATIVRPVRGAITHYVRITRRTTQTGDADA